MDVPLDARGAHGESRQLQTERRVYKHETVGRECLREQISGLVLACDLSMMEPFFFHNTYLSIVLL